jgi:hypothetical protein
MPDHVGRNMRAVLAGTFDLRESFGIADSVFADGYARPPVSIGDIGVSNPLGWGTIFSIDADDAILKNWRVVARQQLDREAMQDSLGWSGGSKRRFARFKERLALLLEGHPVEHCDLTLYSIGVVYMQLHFRPGVPHPYVEGFLNCFEFAGYTSSVSQDLYELAATHRRRALRGEGGLLRDLTKRMPPERVVDAKGYEESRQFQYFRHLLLCIDPGDKPVVPRLLANIDDPVEPLRFELHGTLHYSSGLYVFESKGLDGSEDTATMTVNAQRILVDIEIAHVFEGICDAFSGLILEAIRTQVNAYSADAPNSLEPQRLNRLRALALAVVNLTQFELVTPTEEDQNFFKRFEAEARLGKKHSLIAGAVEVLYSVQVAEEQERVSRRASRFGKVATLLTSLTLISVIVDSYNFVREDQQILPALILRAVTLTLLLMLIVMLALRMGKDEPSR